MTGSARDGLQVAAQGAEQLGARAVAAAHGGGEDLGELAQRALALALDHRLEQRGEVAEVAVDDRPA